MKKNRCAREIFAPSINVGMQASDSKDYESTYNRIVITL